MTTIVTLTPSTPERVYPAVRAQHEGLSLLIVFSQKEDGAPGFCARSITDALPKLGNDPQWAQCLRHAPVVLVSVDGGKPYKEQVIQDLMFYGLMINMPEWNPFKTRACIMLRDAARGKATVPDDVADDPLVQSMKRDYELSIATARAAREAGEAKLIAARADRKADHAINLAETSLELQVGTGNRLKGIPELARRGWTFTKSQYGAIGGQLRTCALKIGDNLDAHPKMYWQGDYVNTHIPETFDTWEKDFGPRYPRKKR